MHDDNDAARRLEAAIARGRELADMGDALTGRAVADAREAGLSWTEIGQAFGTSKQAAQQRYGPAVPQPGAWPGRWSDDARRALDRACEEAAALGHAHVGTAHALLALASAEGGAAVLLAGLGVTRERVLATSCMRRGTAGTGAPRPLMPRLKQALEHSLRIADVAGGEHLLAGILSVEDSMAVEILRRMKVRPDEARAALAARLGVDPRQLGARRRRRLLAGSR